MSESKKSIIGIDLGIDPEYLESVVRSTVEVGIAEALGGKDAVASEIIHSVLTQKIGRNGELVNERTSSYNREGALPLIDYYTLKVVRECAKEIVVEIIEERRDDIKAAIKKAMKEQKFLDTAAETFMSQAISSARCDWTMDVTLSVKNEEEY